MSAGVLGLGRRGRLAIPVFWGAVTILFELGQYAKLLSGVFDTKDLAAGVAGSFAAAFAFWAARGGDATATGGRSLIPGLRQAAGAAVVLSGVACLLATAPYEDCAYEPVYLSYSDLRKPVAAVGPQALSKPGKIYVYGGLLLINEPNKGVHIVDNSDPRTPASLLFLPIPGNIDVAVKDNIMYADSYIDLVAVDLGDMNNVREAGRVEGVFPYDPYQTIPDTSVYICGYDETRGVVVGYERKRRRD